MPANEQGSHRPCAPIDKRALETSAAPGAPAYAATMTAPTPFPQAGFLDYLQSLRSSAGATAASSLPPGLAGWLSTAEHAAEAAQTREDLIALLQARRASLQAASDTRRVADELRRYQKFARPGPPPPHIVGLRQQQAAARRATSVSRQSFVAAAAAFVRQARIAVPARVALEVFIERWIDSTIPKNFSPND